jgi:hypothetical protein
MRAGADLGSVLGELRREAGVDLRTLCGLANVSAETAQAVEHGADCSDVSVAKLTGWLSVLLHARHPRRSRSEIVVEIRKRASERDLAEEELLRRARVPGDSLRPRAIGASICHPGLDGDALPRIAKVLGTTERDLRYKLSSDPRRAGWIDRADALADQARDQAESAVFPVPAGA